MHTGALDSDQQHEVQHWNKVKQTQSWTGADWLDSGSAEGTWRC